jgi:hypothetical protein
MDSLEWKRAVVDLARLKQQIDDIDSTHLFEYRLPLVAAQQSTLQAIERHIGEPLDEKYRSFLQHAGGWPAFQQTVDLFGPEDLIGRTRNVERAEELLGYLDEEGTLQLSKLRRSDVLPIAVTCQDMDVFVICRTRSETPGQVVWFASYEIERFAEFDGFYLAILELHRRRLANLLQARGAGIA